MPASSPATRRAHQAAGGAVDGEHHGGRGHGGGADREQRGDVSADGIAVDGRRACDAASGEQRRRRADQARPRRQRRRAWCSRAPRLMASVGATCMASRAGAKALRRTPRARRSRMPVQASASGERDRRRDGWWCRAH